MADLEHRWHWRNTRDIAVSLWFSPVNWYFGFDRADDYSGGHMVFGFGPFAVRIEYGIGNVSRERCPFGLSESEAWERSAKYER